MNFSRTISRLSTLNGKRSYALDFAMGALAVLGLAPFYLSPLTLLCLAVLYIRLSDPSLEQAQKRAVFARGFWFGLGYFLFGLYWIGAAFLARGGAFVWIMPVAVFVMCAGLAIFWGGAALLFVKLRGAKVIRQILVFTLVFTGGEVLRGHVFGGFPWNLPGYIFEGGKPVSQSAHFIGIYGLTALVFLFAGALGALAVSKKFAPVIVTALVFLSLYGYGYNRLKNAEIKYLPNVTLRLVHAHISQKDKFDSAKYVEIANKYLNLTMSDGFENVTHIVWPEGALPGLVLENEDLLDALESLFLSRTDTPPVFITQTLRREQDIKTGKTRYYNSVAAVRFYKDKPRQISLYYDKHKLVPFGEFVPGGQWIEKLGIESLSTAVESMSAGKSNIMPDLPQLPPVSIQICYEILFPGFTPKKLQPSGLAPKWILNLSNDSWYGDSAGPKQQSNHARYRAIETGLPVVRSTSGGITALIDPYGRLVKWRNIGDNSVLDIHLPVNMQ